MKSVFTIAVIFFVVFFFEQCTSSGQSQKQSPDTVTDEKKGLKDYYAAYFPIGVAVSPRALKTDEAPLILQQFNSITPENAMKMGPIHPKENEYNWSGADSIAAFAKRNKLKLRGHTLCWHNQAPDWFFKNAEGNPVTKEVLLQRLKDHITTVVKRYKDVIYAWDVVNEVISDKPDEYFNLEKLRKAAHIDRKISIREVVEKIFGIIPKFKSKDELLEEEFDKFISIYPPEDDVNIRALKYFFKASIVFTLLVNTGLCSRRFNNTGY